MSAYAAASTSLPQPYKVEMILDQNIYRPGDTVTGKIYLDLNKHLTCDIIQVQLFGQLRVYWTEEKTTQTALRKVEAFEKKRVLVDRNEIIWRADPNMKPQKPTLEEITRMASATAIRHKPPKNENVPGLGKGRHELSFALDLPKQGLLSTFESKQSPGCVQYWVELTCQSRSTTALRRKVLFAVVVDVDLNDLPRAIRSAEETKNFSFGSNNDVKVTMKLLKTGFTPGESIDAEISIENRSKKSIKYCTLNILQKHYCVAEQPHFATRETKFESPGLPMPMEKVVAGASHTYQTNGHFHVPALPLATSVQDFLVVDYFLQLTIGFERNKRAAAFGNLQIPIQIGTMKLRRRSDPEPLLPGLRDRAPSPSAPPQNVPSLPPPAYGTYENLLMNTDYTQPPPVYEEIDPLLNLSESTEKSL